MDVDQTLLGGESVSKDVPSEPYSASWWRARTTEELREMMSGDIGLSRAFEGASAEAERRAREYLRTEEASKRAEADRKRRLRLSILGIFLLAGLFGILASLLFR